MSQPTNTVDTYGAIGIREDLSNIIYNIAPTETPLINAIGKDKAANTLFEWQTDTLATAANNAQIEGNDTVATAFTPTVRVNNRTQISSKAPTISGTEEAVNKAGRKSEMSLQIAKMGKEIKRDMEFALCQNTTAVTGSSTVARQTRGLEGWVATNNDLGVGGVAPNPTSNTAPTDGTQRAVTEAMLKNVCQLIWTQGGNPDMVMVGAANKQNFSAFTGGNTKFDKSEDKRITAAFDYYVSDFGTLHIVPNRFQRARTAFVLQTDMWSVAYLRPFQVQELGKTGDSEKRLLVVEYGLKANNEKASGAIRDLS